MGPSGPSEWSCLLHLKSTGEKCPYSPTNAKRHRRSESWWWLGRRIRPGDPLVHTVMAMDEASKGMRFARWAWAMLAYTALVIIFGAFVRASLSGDGCGRYWPLCHGAWVPDGTLQSVAEYTHRVTSGICLLLVLGLYVYSRRTFSAGALPRKAAGWAFVFTMVSAAVGAVLVLFQLVAVDRSLARGVVMPLHLINTYFLVGALAVSAWSAGRGQATLPSWGDLSLGIKCGAFAMLALAATGAISALGNTAWQFDGFLYGLQARLAPDAHPLLRGGIAHPLIATSAAVYLLWLFGSVVHFRPAAKVRFWARWSAGLTLFQMGFGVANVLLSAPLWMQLTHLALAVALWLTFVMMSMELAVAPVPVVDAEAKPAAPAPLPVARAVSGCVFAPSPALPSTQATRCPLTVIKSYVALTKPRVISLLLFTTVAAQVIVARGWPDTWLVLAVLVGGYMAAGAANTFNMLLEPDLDLAMGRTASRPTVQGVISSSKVFAFGLALAIGSFAILWSFANLLTAFLALAGLLFYVFIYTLLLKRRTWQNIVVGGAAGAFPPLVGWASVTGELNPMAWTLFAIVFAWTPVHFWALALLLKEDYRRAGVPMLPVVHGERVTVVQIMLYSLLTAIISCLPLVQRELGMFYLMGAVVLNSMLLLQSLQLLRVTEPRQARSLFRFSMVYLALLFLIAAVDRAVWS